MEDIEITLNEISTLSHKSKWKRLDENCVIVSLLHSLFYDVVKKDLRKYVFEAYQNIQLELNFTRMGREKIVIKLKIHNAQLDNINNFVYGSFPIDDTDISHTRLLNFLTFYDKVNSTITLWDRENYLDSDDRIDFVLYANLTEIKKIKTSLTNNLNTCTCKKDARDFRKLLNNSHLSDLVLIVSGKKLFVHQAILAGRSPVFYEILRQNQELNQMEILDFDIHLIELFLEYVYTLEISVQLHSELAMELLPISIKYSVDGLTEKMESIMINEMSMENVFKGLILAHNYQLMRLKKECIDFVVKNKKSFDPDKFKLQLKNINKLNNSSELYIELLIAVMQG